MQPCDELVLRLMAVERCGPTLTLWVRYVRKLLIQRQVGCGSPVSDSLFTSLWRRMVLNAKLKSIKSIRA